MAVLTTCVSTFVDLNEIHIGTMPTNPVNNQIWFDTESNVLKKYNSSNATWEIVNDYTEDILNALKDLQVSSRNLLASTSYESQIVCSGGANKTGGQYYFVGTINYVNNIKDKEITLAFDWEIITDGTPSGTFRAQTTGIEQIQIGDAITLSNSNYYGTCVFTTTLTTAFTINGINFRTDEVTGTLKITHPRLFYGSKDLGWSQAPEDIDGKFETIIDKQQQGIYISVSDTGNNTKTLVDFNSQKLLVSSSNIDLQGYVTISSLSDPSSTTIIDGNLIKTDTLSANKVKTGTLQGKNSSSYFNLDDGTFSLANATQSLMTFDGSSLTFQNNVNYNLDKDDFSSNLDWIKNWTEGSTVINSKQVMSPRAFFGTVNASRQATGISLGGALNKIYETEGTYSGIDEGLAGYKAGVKTFHFKSDGTLLIGPNTTGNYISWDGSALTLRATSMNIGTYTVATTTNISTAVSALQLKFTQNGGYNLIKNSTGASGSTNGWTHNGTSLGVSTNDSIGSNCKTFMYLDNGTTTAEKYAYSSRFKLKSNTKYTLTGYYYNYTTCPNFDVWLLSSTTLSDSDTTTNYTNAQAFITAQNTAGIWKKITATITTPASTMSGIIRIDHNGYNSSGTGTNRVCWNALMLVEGELENVWSSHPSEIYEGITSVDKDGIVVTSSNVKSKTTMDASGFKITKTDTSEDVFSVNTDGTLDIKGNINGGSINLSNNFIVDPLGNVTTAGNVILGGTINANGNITASNLSLTGGLIDINNSAFKVDGQGNVTTAGNVNLGGTINANGNITATNLKLNGGGININNAFIVDDKGNVTTSGKVTISNQATVPSTTLSGAILSNQLDSSITSDISTAKLNSDLLAQGLNKWMVTAYDIAGAGYTNTTVPTFNMLANRNIKFTKEILDSNTSSNMNLGDNYIGHAKTNIYLDSDYSFTTALTTDDASAIYLNGILVTTTVSCTAKSITLNLKAGWNTVEVLYTEISGGDGFVFSPKFNATTQIKRINAYEISSASISSNLISESKDLLDTNKNNWSNAYSRVVEWASSAVTGSTTINGGFIETNTITAKQMAIGDFNNYSQLAKGKNLSNRFGTATWVENTLNDSYWQSSSSYFPFTINETNNPFKAGDKIQIKLDACTVTSRNVSIGIWFYSDIACVTNVGSITGSISCNSTWGTKSVNLTLPEGNSYVQNAKSVAILISNGSSGEVIQVRNAVVARQVAGDLIVDGSITTNHINTIGLDAGVIKAGTISADRIDADVIVSKVNGATTSITGDKIRTGIISATSGGSYLNLSNGSMLLGTTSGSNYLQWTGTALNIKANSLSIGGTTAATTTNVSTAKTEAISDAVGVKDTRSTNENPSWYFTNYPKRTVQEFKNLTAIGLTGTDTYGNLETKVPWTDSSGGYPTQTFYGNGTEIFTRKGTSNTEWSAWTRKVNATQNDVFNTLTNNGTNQGIYIQDGKVLINATMIKTGVLDSSLITTNTLEGEKIKAGTILAEKIAIGDFSNYSELNTDTLSKWGFTSEVDSSAASNPWFVRDSLTRYTQISRFYQCNGGETLRIKADISTTVYGQSVSGGTATPVPRGIRMMIIARDNTGVLTYLTNSDLTVTATSTSVETVATVNGVITLASNIREFSLYIQINGYATYSGVLKLRNVFMNKMSTGELIVDGSIKSNHIDTNSIKAEHIDVNSINSDHVDINGNGFAFYSSKTFNSTTNTYDYGDTIFSIKNEDGQNSTVTIKPDSFILKGRNSKNDKDVSIILKDNVLTIDASAITTGVLDASLITTGELDASLIKGGTIKGDQINTEDFTVVNNTTGKSTFAVKGGKVYVSSSDFIITPEAFDINTLTDNNSLTSELAKEKERIDQYIRFNSGTIELGQAKGNYQATLTSSALTFYEKGSAVSWISGNTMYMTNNRSTDSLEIGPIVGGGRYKWDYQDNGHLNLSWFSN